MDIIQDNVRMIAQVGQQVGRYRLLCFLGLGNYSEAYLGEHVDLHSLCVVKVLQTRLLHDLLDSYLEETHRLAELAHPNIVRVLDAGVADNVPFLVMDYAPNGTMRQYYPTGPARPLTALLPKVKQAATALQFAHDRGFLHQNIRPENMLLGLNNEVLLSDFNINAVALSRNHWGLKEVTGSVAYSAPEQMLGKPCPASDQYALGFVIYEWLSGEHPYRGSFIEIAHQHLRIPPPPLRRKAPMISHDVEEVIMTAIAKDPRQRFAKVSAFVNALEQALPTPGRDKSGPYALSIDNLGAINRAVAANSLLPAVSGSASPVPLQGMKPRHLFSRRSFLAVGLTGLVALGAGGVGLTLLQRSSSPSLASNTPATSTALPRGATIFTYRGHSARVSSVAWSPDGTRIASASDDMVVQICNGTTGATLLTYRGHTSEIYTVAWSPDGKYLTSAGADQAVHVWSPVTGKRIITYHGHADAVNAVAWSPDGQSIASASDDHTIQIWNAVNGKRTLIYGGHSAGVLTLAWSPDGKRIASGAWDNTVQFWDPATGNTGITYRGHSAEVYAVAWSPDGQRLASASGDTVVQVCDTNTGATSLTYRRHSDAVLATAWSPNGKYIASGGYDNSVQVWEAATGNFIFAYHGHSNWVNTVAWSPVPQAGSPDNQRIASAGNDDTMQVWQI